MLRGSSKRTHLRWWHSNHSSWTCQLRRRGHRRGAWVRYQRSHIHLVVLRCLLKWPRWRPMEREMLCCKVWHGIVVSRWRLASERWPRSRTRSVRRAMIVALVLHFDGDQIRRMYWWCSDWYRLHEHCRRISHPGNGWWRGHSRWMWGRQYSGRQVRSICSHDARPVLSQNVLRWGKLRRHSWRTGHNSWRCRRRLWPKHKIWTVADYCRHWLTDTVRQHSCGACWSCDAQRWQHLCRNNSWSYGLATGTEMTMCNVCLQITLGQIRPMTARNSVLSASERTDEHRAERSLLNAHNALTAATTTPLSWPIKSNH